MEQLKQTSKASGNARLIGGQSTLPSLAEGTSRMARGETMLETLKDAFTTGGLLLAGGFLRKLEEGEPKIEVEATEPEEEKHNASLLEIINELSKQTIEKRRSEEDYNYYHDYDEPQDYILEAKEYS